MTVKKIEREVKLMKAQILFIETQQKVQKNINKQILAYSGNVTLNTSNPKLQILNSAKRSKSALTFQVYSHLRNSEKEFL